MNPIIIIPARMEATRLPGKPLADIHGVPMIVHVWKRAKIADVGPVLVSAANSEIGEKIRPFGVTTIQTKPEHPSGSDRVYEALMLKDPSEEHDIVVNLQGDLPTIDPELIRAVLKPLEHRAVDIATLVVEIVEARERTDPNVVKAAVGFDPGSRIGRALYFSRNVVPAGDGPLYHHIGIYAYRRPALARFVALPPGVLERREKLEQLRALEHGMRIDAARVDTVPLGVDTPADLERARVLLASR